MRRFSIFHVAISAALSSLFLPSVGIAQISVLTQYYDNARDGVNANETTLTPSNVNTSTFGKLFSLPADGRVFAQPLYVPDVAIPGNGTHNVVYVATQHDTVFAYDADGLQIQPLWNVNLATIACPTGFTCSTVPYTDNTVGVNNDIIPEIGITSTPVIDASTNTIFVVAKTKEVSGSTTNYLYRLHALNITTGAEQANSPVVIQGQVPGNGYPNNGGELVFSPFYSEQRPGLALVNNAVYVAFGSWGDSDFWHGWVFGYDETSLAQLSAFSTTPNGNEGRAGIWMHGAGLNSDSSGNLFFSSGNGAFDGLTNYGDSFLKLSTPGLTVLDYFTPSYQAILDPADLDVAAGGLILLPDSAGTSRHPHIMIGCSKNGTIYVIDRDDLGQFNSSGDSQIIQEMINVIGGQTANNQTGVYVENCYSSPAYWQGNVYWGGISDSVKMFSFTNGLMSTTPSSSSSEIYEFPGASPVISANGTSHGIVWTIEDNGNLAPDNTGTTAILHAYDATNLANELYNSNQVASDAAGTPVKFVVPTVVNGKVYVATQSSVAVYGLTNGLTQAAAPVFNPAGGGFPGPVTVTISESTAGTTVYYTTDGSVPTTSSNVYTSPVTLNSSTTLKAMAVGGGYRESPITTGTYTINAPMVSSVSPNVGSTVGGTAVTITGANFAAPATVTFGSNGATNVTVVSNTQITATTPAGSAGTVTVTVTSNGQYGSLNNGFTYVSGSSIAFAQVAAATPQSPTQVVPVAFPGAQSAGDLNVVVVGWDDLTATVRSVKDSAGNVYSPAIGPTKGTGLQQSIYYASNIVAGNNTVTVTFNQAATYPDVRILEYMGVSVLDATSGASGSNSLTNSGPATITAPTELIIGANYVQTETQGPGSGFTARIISVPDSDIVEDMVSAAGTFSATAPLKYAGPWVMQMVTFKPSGSGNAPTISSVSPNAGPLAGGTAVTITGANFATPATASFGSNAATNVTVVSSTQITATTPAGSAGAVTVMVTSNGQNGSLTNGFTYTPAPVVSSVSPNVGSTGGGTAVTITGANFATPATATFGSNAATNVTVVSSTQITANTPAGSAGAVTVMVTSNGQNGSLNNGFTYTAAPTISSVSPNAGPLAGGTAVTITGANFATPATASFGSNAATNVTVVSSTQITATTPAGSAGAVTVKVTANGQNGSLTNGFTYTAAPTISSVSPNAGPLAGGTAVTITGANFATPATASFGSNAATNVTVVSSTQITATTPAGSAGAVTVKVTANGQNGSLTNGFTYTAAPTISSVSPNAGPLAGGTAVTITGANFATPATASFGSNAATNVTVVSSTQITATTPAGSAGAVTVMVTSNGQNGSLTNGFTYTPAPVVSSVSPNVGSTGGGTAVTITGANFATPATATFGSNAATNVTVVSSTQITANTPAGSAGAVTVTVTSNGQNGSLNNGFTFATPPTVGSVSPNTGSTAGGTAITISGTNFASGATVTLGGSGATNVVVVSTTSITASTPAHAAGAATVTVTNANNVSGSLNNGFTYVSGSSIAFAQVAAATPQSPTQVVPVAFPGAQSGGDLNVVVVGWDDLTAAVQSVKDSAGNVYSLAIGPTKGTGLQQSIYYASNIVAGNNTVTVTFNQAATYPDVRILEYKGISTLDATAGASGSNSPTNSGSAKTTAAQELILGANYIQTETQGPGSGFTARIISVPDSDIVEDKVTTATGTFSATAPLKYAGPWVMQMATFK